MSDISDHSGELNDELNNNLDPSQTDTQKPLRFAEQVEQLEKDLAAANAKAEENWDKALRTIAELDNFKRRSQKEIENAHKYSIEKFAKALIPVIDSLEQALISDEKARTEKTENTESNSNSEAMREGIQLTLKMFIESLAKFGLEQINPKGEDFNPEFHEAMSMVPHPEFKTNQIIEVFQNGYILHGRVVRPARVIIAQ